VVLPSITSIKFERRPGAPPAIQVVAAPTIGPQQDVVLWLTEVVPVDATPRRYGLNATTRTVPSNSVTFRAVGIASGTYLARLYVDQAESEPSDHDQVVIP